MTRKAHGIQFSPAMVRAVLKGCKTQTRRLATPPKGFDWLDLDAGTMINQHGHKLHTSDLVAAQPGDLLWGREAWAAGSSVDRLPPRDLDPEHWLRTNGGIWYRADGTSPHRPIDGQGRWRQGMFMPRWASRLAMLTRAVRYERLHEISDEDCVAEGCPGGHGAISGYAYNATPQEHYRAIWIGLHGQQSWDANPVVRVTDFGVLDRQAKDASVGASE